MNNNSKVLKIKFINTASLRLYSGIMGHSWVNLKATLSVCASPPVFDVNPEYSWSVLSIFDVHFFCLPFFTYHTYPLLVNESLCCLLILQYRDYKMWGQVFSWVVN